MKTFLVVLSSLVTVAVSSFAAEMPKAPLTLESFWTPALTNSPTLDVEIMATNQANGISILRMRYTGSTFQGKPQRVFALYAQPNGPGPFPAVLQIHGGGQTCYPENVAYFVKRGYACLSFDWTGPRDNRPGDSVTHWADPITGNYFGADGDDPRQMLLYHTTLAAIRGIDVLTSRPEVDRERIGVQGISWGGFLTWLVNGLDRRVKVALPVYGIGDLDEQWNDMGRTLQAKDAESRQRWRELFDPASFARRQNGAVMFLDGANDFFGPQDLAERRLGELRVEHRRSYSANRMHGLDEGTVLAGMVWLDAHLKPGVTKFPKEVRIHFATSDAGELIATVEPDSSARVRSVHFDFSRGDLIPLLRCWLSKDAVRGVDGKWSCPIPLVNSAGKLGVVAQVTYESGMMLSSSVHEFRPALKLLKRPHATVVPSNVIIDASEAPGGIYIPTGTDFIHADPPPGRLRKEMLAGRLAYIYESVETGGAIRLATRRMVDPATLPGARDQLEIWTHDVARMQVRLNYFLREPGAEEFEANATPGAGWQRSILSLTDFAPFNEDTGKVDPQKHAPLKNWNEVHQIELICEPVPGGKVGLRRINWRRGGEY